METTIYTLLPTLSDEPTKSYKSLFQELVQKKFKLVPYYEERIIEQEPSGNVTVFGSRIVVNDEIISE